MRNAIKEHANLKTRFRLLDCFSAKLSFKYMHICKVKENRTGKGKQEKLNREREPFPWVVVVLYLFYSLSFDEWKELFQNCEELFCLCQLLPKFPTEKVHSQSFLIKWLIFYASVFLMLHIYRLAHISQFLRIRIDHPEPRKHAPPRKCGMHTFTVPILCI